MNAAHKATLIFFGALFLILAALDYFDKLNFVEGLGIKIVNPLIHLVYKQNVRIRNLGTFLKSRDEVLHLVEERDNLALQLKHLEVTNAQLTQENDELKSQLNFLKRQNYKWLLCSVVGKSIEERATGLIIDCGLNDGVQKGYAVVAGDGVLVGKISEVKNTISMITLITDSKSKVAVSVLNNDKSIGVVGGGFGLSLHLTFVPQNETLKPGELVITSGLERLTPRGLIIGTLESVSKEPFQPFQRGIVRPPLDFQKLLILSVIIAE